MTRNLWGSPTSSSVTNSNPQVHVPPRTPLTSMLSYKLCQAPRTLFHLHEGVAYAISRKPLLLFSS